MASYDEVLGYLTNKTTKSDISIKEAHLSHTPNTENTKVALIYGHDKVARNGIELICRRLKFETFILSNVGVNSETIYRQIVQAIKTANFVIAILTHDDFAYAGKDENKTLRPRARQNVILELGVALGSMDLQRIMIITRNGIEIPSDLDGVIRFSYQQDVSDCYLDIAKVFQRNGYDVDLNAVKNY